MILGKTENASPPARTVRRQGNLRAKAASPVSKVLLRQRPIWKRSSKSFSREQDQFGGLCKEDGCGLCLQMEGLTPVRERTGGCLGPGRLLLDLLQDGGVCHPHQAGQAKQHLLSKLSKHQPYFHLFTRGLMHEILCTVIRVGGQGEGEGRVP